MDRRIAPIRGKWLNSMTKTKQKLLRICGALFALLTVVGYVAFRSQDPLPNVDGEILKLAIGGDPVAMYRVGARKSDNRDTYAWFVVSSEYIAAAPIPHSVEMNRTELEVKTAVQLFRERFGDAERADAEARVESVRKLIQTRTLQH